MDLRPSLHFRPLPPLVLHQNTSATLDQWPLVKATLYAEDKNTAERRGGDFVSGRWRERRGDVREAAMIGMVETYVERWGEMRGISLVWVVERGVGRYCRGGGDFEVEK